MSQQAEDRRRFFRVPDELPLHLVPLDAAGVEHLLEEIAAEGETRFGLAASFAATTSQMEHVLNRIREQSADVALYLQSINQKLDAVARVMLLEEERVAHLETMEVDLSASGLGVTWPVTLEIGQAVRVELVTPAASARVLALGRVTRCEPAAAPGEGGGFRVAVDFERIRDHDEDLIMQEVMRRQAALLRERRGHREGD